MSKNEKSKVSGTSLIQAAYGALVFGYNSILIGEAPDELYKRDPEAYEKKKMEMIRASRFYDPKQEPKNEEN